MDYDPHCMNFWDISIKVNENGQLYTTLYTKPMERNTLLQYNSHHPQALKDGLPFSQFLHLLRNCTCKEDYFSEAKKHKEKLQARVYPVRLLKRSLKRAWYNNREALFEVKKRCNQPQLVCVSTFGTHSNKIKKIISKHWTLFKCLPEFKQKPMFSFKRGSNLKDRLVHAYKTSDTGIVDKMLQLMAVVGHYKCNMCAACGTTNTIKTFRINGQQVTLKHFSNCNTSNVVYCIKCPCGLHYIGKTVQQVKKRILQHQSRIRCKVENAPLVEHYTKLKHSEKDMVWWVIEVKACKRKPNVEQVLTMKEHCWICRTDNVAKGLNLAVEWHTLTCMM